LSVRIRPNCAKAGVGIYYATKCQLANHIAADGLLLDSGWFLNKNESKREKGREAMESNQSKDYT
jgi:hypothetical protein